MRTPSKSKFAKSISTGDLLRSIKKETLQETLKKTKEDSFTPIKCYRNNSILSESDSTSESAKLRYNINNLLQHRSELDTGSSEFGESIVFMEVPRDFETELERNTPKHANSGLQHPCMNSEVLRQLTSNVFDVMVGDLL